MSKKQGLKKSPYKSLTVEEVAKVESNSFVIQVGEDFFSSEDRYAFTKSKAEYFYSEIYNNLIDLLYNGTQIEKAEVITMLGSFRILPLRLH